MTSNALVHLVRGVDRYGNRAVATRTPYRAGFVSRIKQIRAGLPEWNPGPRVWIVLADFEPEVRDVVARFYSEQEICQECWAWRPCAVWQFEKRSRQ